MKQNKKKEVIKNINSLNINVLRVLLWSDKQFITAVKPQVMCKQETAEADLH